MNRLLYQAATATANTSRLPGIFRLDMSILRRLIGHGRALFRYHIEAYGSRNPGIFHKLDPLVAGGRSNILGPGSFTGAGGPIPSNGPLDWLGKEISSRWRYGIYIPITYMYVSCFKFKSLNLNQTILFFNISRKLFVNSILNRVTNSLSNELKTKASHQLLYGNNARPFFALVGVSLASGGGILTKEQEFEGICYEIRVSFIKFHLLYFLP